MNALIDTRERNPFYIYLNEFITGVEHMKLDAGDYSIESLEEVVAIERKGSAMEFAHNITEPRFWDALSRLEQVRHPIIVMSFPLDHIYRYPKISEIRPEVQAKLTIQPQFIISKINEIMMRKIPIVFAGDKCNAEKITNDFLCKIVKRYKKC